MSRPALRRIGKLNGPRIRIIPLIAYVCAAAFGILVWYELIRLIVG